MSTFGAREHIRRAIHAMVQSGADAGVISRPVISTDPAGPAVQQPRALPAITAARQLRWAAEAALHEQVRYARGDGDSWRRIGEAIYGTDKGMTPAALQMEAFHYVASTLGDAASFAWVCGECHSSVIDRGPETGSPYDAEQGHAADCARFADAVRIYETD